MTKWLLIRNASEPTCAGLWFWFDCIPNLISSCWDDWDGSRFRHLRFDWHLSGCDTTILETKWRVQKFLHREMDKLHEFCIRPQIMLFFCFSVKEVLVSGHFGPLSGLLLHNRIHCPDALRYSYLCVLIDQDSVKVLRLDIVITRRNLFLTKITLFSWRKADAQPCPFLVVPWRASIFQTSASFPSVSF